jgi:predicted RNA-binding Zn-ribbon protein involved in translation (DUF1610 family)
MQPVLPSTTLNCTQCGGELHPAEGQIFLTCPYCASTVYLDRSRVVFHWYIAPTLDEPKAQGMLRRWMAGNQTVKDLDTKASIRGASFEYFPLWYFKLRTSAGREEIVFKPAAATAVSEIIHMSMPPGDLRRYTPDLDDRAHMPTVPLDTARSWLNGQHGAGSEILEQALVHVPVYTFTYEFQNRRFTALVEAASGGVFANIFPAKAEAPYRTVGLLTASIFTCLAMGPIAGAAMADLDGALVGLAVCTGLGLLAAPLLFMLAVWVAAKI